MKTLLIVFGTVLFPFAVIAPCQETPKKEPVPLYNVTVVERTTKAINYAYRGGPTKIDFRGTVLLPEAKGDATVESLRGRTEIDARFENLLPTDRFGRQYLTYCLWAITPEGGARNLGEIVPDSSNKAKLHVTTNLDTFGLIVTAEPYAATLQPSDVVVLENQVRADTVGKIEEIDARYELLPRGHYTWERPANLEFGAQARPKVSMKQYEAMLELYEAQNAVWTARAAGADRYAPETLAKAQALLEEAQRSQAANGGQTSVVEAARESAQTAEDALVLAQRRKAAQQLSEEQRKASQARQAEAQARAAASRAQAEAAAARAQDQADREALAHAEANAAETRAQLAQEESAPMVHELALKPKSASEAERTDLRIRLFHELDNEMATLDTPRGLIVTIPDSEFDGAEPVGGASRQIARLFTCIAPYTDLRLEVDGYSDTPAGVAQSERRAENVRRLLLDRGMAADRVTAHGFGASRPVASNGTAGGRAANRRVEVVIAGDSIGARAAWDQTYSLIPGLRPMSVPKLRVR